MTSGRCSTTPTPAPNGSPLAAPSRPTTCHDPIVGTARWAFLSPSGPGWGWVPGHRGGLRRLVRAEIEQTGDRPNALRTTLRTLRVLSATAESLGTERLLLVTEAHIRGATWAQIAACLGRTRQSAHQRYQHRVYAHATRQILLDDLDNARRHAIGACARRLDPQAVAESLRLLDCDLSLTRERLPSRWHAGYRAEM